MTERWRAVFDTNIYLSAALSQNERSPSRELLARLAQAQFDLLTCQVLLDELIEKLTERGLAAEAVAGFAASIISLSETIDIPAEAIEAVIAKDPDDDIVLACAVLGQANVIATYDRHFDVLGGMYRGIPIMTGLAFLQKLRESLQSES
ncbi:MAG: putative toxin-antitoxin system toxin component, PIN family [Chloroflexota bacterium]